MARVGGTELVDALVGELMLACGDTKFVDVLAGGDTELVDVLAGGDTELVDVIVGGDTELVDVLSGTLDGGDMDSYGLGRLDIYYRLNMGAVKII